MEASPFRRRGGDAVAWWLTPRTPDPGWPYCVLEQDIFTPPPPKVLVIPRERWLRPNMTEKNCLPGCLASNPINTKSFLMNQFFFLLRPVYFLFSFDRAMLFILANQEMCIFLKIKPDYQMLRPKKNV